MTQNVTLFLCTSYLSGFCVAKHIYILRHALYFGILYIFVSLFLICSLSEAYIIIYAAPAVSATALLREERRGIIYTYRRAANKLRLSVAAKSRVG